MADDQECYSDLVAYEQYMKVLVYEHKNHSTNEPTHLKANVTYT